jgi:hypothetical protein
MASRGLALPSKPAPRVVPLAPCNVDAARVFEHSKPRFQIGMGGAVWTGLDPSDIRLAADALGVTLNAELLGKLRHMEGTAVHALNSKRNA